MLMPPLGLSVTSLEVACPPIGLSVERELRKPGLLWIQLYKTSPPIAAIGGSVERAKVEKGGKSVSIITIPQILTVQERLSMPSYRQ